MKTIKEILREMREKRRQDKATHAENFAKILYQITEHEGQLWFTYNGSLFSPCSLLCDDTSPVAMLGVLRKLYVERVVKSSRTHA